MVAFGELAARLTVFPAMGLSVDESNVTTAVVPCAPIGAGVEAVTVDADGETASVPNVTVAVLAMTVLAVVSVAVKVTPSVVMSVAVNMTIPCALVTLGVV